MLPEVESKSRRSPPNGPSRMARRRMCSAGLSFTEPAGLSHSALASTCTCGDKRALVLRNGINGVFPTQLSNPVSNDECTSGTSMGEKKEIGLGRESEADRSIRFELPVTYGRVPAGSSAQQVQEQQSHSGQQMQQSQHIGSSAGERYVCNVPEPGAACQVAVWAAARCRGYAHSASLV